MDLSRYKLDRETIMPRKGFLAVLLLLVTMSFGQVSVRAQAAPSDDEFLRHVSQTHNVPLARLRMADRVAVEFSLTGVHLHKAKVIDTASGQAYQVALDNQHQPADLQAAADAETRAEVALYGKLDPRLYRLKAAAAATDRLPVSIWIEVPPPSFKRSSDRVSYHTALKKYLADHEKGLRDALAKRGISITISQLGPVIFANLTPAQIDWAAGHALVSRIYSAEEDNELAEANGVTTHRAYSVWASGNLGAGTAAKPVILDPYGVSDANPYLHNSTHSVVYWCSSVSARCPNGKNIGQHATAVAGVIASTHPMARGVAPAASAILSANTQDFSDSKVVEALEWGLANGGNPIIIPWSIECGGAQTSLSRYLDWAVRILHATIVVSTGNTATTCLDAANNLDPKLGENVSSPGVAWNVITVGSHTDGNTGFWLDDAMSAFSAWRNPEFAPGMEKPEVVAVGENIRTTDDTLAHDWLTQDGVNGTSFSAPLVAGQIALMLSRQPGQTVWPETNKAAVLASAFHDIAGGFAEQSEDGVGSVTMNHSDETYRLGRFVNGSRAGVPLQAADFPQNYENSMTLAAGDRVRVATVWDSISNGSTSDVLGADIDLCIRQPDDMTIIACSSSLENAWELVEFTAPVSGQYDILIDLYGSDVDWPGTFLGTAWAIESTPNFCTGGARCAEQRWFLCRRHIQRSHPLRYLCRLEPDPVRTRARAEAGP
jgi:hypothetical protein